MAIKGIRTAIENREPAFIWRIGHPPGVHRHRANLVSGKTVTVPSQGLGLEANVWNMPERAIPIYRTVNRSPEGASRKGRRCCFSAVNSARGSPPLAGRLRRPQHLRIEPHGQRSTALERLFIRWPVQGLVGRNVRSAHQLQLSRWIHDMNPWQDLCNRAPSRQRYRDEAQH